MLPMLRKIYQLVSSVAMLVRISLPFTTKFVVEPKKLIAIILFFEV